MSYKILTKNGVENTNIDDARNHHFNSGGKSGIVKGELNEGNVFSGSSNVIALDTCELRLCGHRVIINEVEYITLSSTPAQAIRYSLIAEIKVVDSNPSFNLFYQAPTTMLIQNNLSADLLGNGTYQMEIGKFTLNTDGTISDIVRTADLINGGGNNVEGGHINIGNITTNTLDAGMEAEIDIEERYDVETNKTFTDFTFSIPKGDDGKRGDKGDKGDKGDTGLAAGFGNPQISVTTLSAGSNATASITASGSDDSKVFNFNLGIPRGFDGTGMTINGTPTTVDFSSNPQTQINQLSNPNLLINSDFKINQRSSTSYTSGYTVDRWHIYQESKACKVVPNYDGSWKPGILVNNSSGTTYARFKQYLEDYEFLANQSLTITCGVKTISGTVKIYTIGTNASEQYSNALTTGINSFTLNCDGTLTQVQIGIELSAGSQLELQYIKAEVGNKATPYVPFPRAIELALCQRYYLSTKVMTTGYTYGSSTFDDGYSRVYIPIYTPVTMRYSSSANFVNYSTNNFQVLIDGKASSFSYDKLEYVQRQDSYILLRGQLLTANDYRVAFVHNIQLRLDAEIYEE